MNNINKKVWALLRVWFLHSYKIIRGAGNKRITAMVTIAEQEAVAANRQVASPAITAPAKSDHIFALSLQHIRDSLGRLPLLPN